MSDREAAMFVIVSDKKQTYTEAILQEKELIIKVLGFVEWATEIKLDCSPGEFFDRVFLCDVYYNKFSSDSHTFGFKRIYNIGEGESFIAIFSRNSAGSWEGLQVFPTRSGLSSNVRYYTFQETIEMPS